MKSMYEGWQVSYETCVVDLVDCGILSWEVLLHLHAV